MDANLISLQGALAAQGFLIELLLGAQLASDTDPAEATDNLRTALDRRLRFNMQVSPAANTPHAELEIQTAALHHLHQLLDNVRRHVSRAKSSQESSGDQR